MVSGAESTQLPSYHPTLDTTMVAWQCPLCAPAEGAPPLPQAGTRLMPTYLMPNPNPNPNPYPTPNPHQVIGCDLLMLACGILAACLDRSSKTGIMMVRWP